MPSLVVFFVSFGIGEDRRLSVAYGVQGFQGEGITLRRRRRFAALHHFPFGRQKLPKLKTTTRAFVLPAVEREIGNC
jgi:hypothetical protein